MTLAASPIPAFHITDPATASLLAREVQAEQATIAAERARRDRDRAGTAAIALANQLDPAGASRIEEIDGQIVLILEDLVFGCLHQPGSTTAYGRLLEHDYDEDCWRWSEQEIHCRAQLAECIHATDGVPNLDEIEVPPPPPPPRACRDRAPSTDERIARALERIARVLERGGRAK